MFLATHSCGEGQVAEPTQSWDSNILTFLLHIFLKPALPHFLRLVTHFHMRSSSVRSASNFAVQDNRCDAQQTPAKSERRNSNAAAARARLRAPTNKRPQIETSLCSPTDSSTQVIGTFSWKVGELFGRRLSYTRRHSPLGVLTRMRSAPPMGWFFPSTFPLSLTAPWRRC
jgi:hypothetical protein